MSSRIYFPVAGALAAALVLPAAAAAAAEAGDPREAYNRRVATRYAESFLVLDRNRDGVVSRSEAAGDLHFVPRFDDMDIDRNERVTADELRRFVERAHGVTVELATPAPAPLPPARKP